MSLDDAASLEQLLAEREAWLRERQMLRDSLEEKERSLEEKERSLEEKERSLEEANLRLEEKEQELRGASDLAQSLQEQVKALLAQRYGRRSEKLTDEEVGQLVLAFGGEPEKSDGKIPNTPPEDPEAPEPTGGEKGGKKKRKYKKGHPGRRQIDDSIERLVDDIKVPPEKRNCPACNHEMKCFKHVEHTRLEYVPAKMIAHVERREVLGCSRSSCKGHVETAPSKHCGRKKSILGYSLIARMIEQKCVDAIPIDRQHDQWTRLGVDIPINTLYSGWNWALDLLSIVGHALLGDILRQPYVRVDDTGLVVLDRHVTGGSRRGHLWFFVDELRRVGVIFTETWAASEIAPQLHQIEGFAQVDDWKGYASLVEDEVGVTRPLIDPEKRLGCAMHIRRRFFEAHRLGNEKSSFALDCFRRLYEVEKKAKVEKMSREQRYRLRQEYSVPILQEFDKWVDEELKTSLPKSKFGKALTYAKNQRTFLNRCLTDGRFEIDNGEPERQIRRPAVGRKNYLFTGSNRGGHRLATAYALVLTCRALGIPVAEYLEDILRKIDQGWNIRQLNELMPGTWVPGDSGTNEAEVKKPVGFPVSAT